MEYDWSGKRTRRMRRIKLATCLFGAMAVVGTPALVLLDADLSLLSAPYVEQATAIELPNLAK